MIRLLLFAIVVSVGISGHTQSPCDCTMVLEQLIQKLETNYIGYTLVKDEVDKEYKAHIRVYNDQAKGVSGTSCTPLLQRFLEFFKDGHLFVTEIPITMQLNWLPLNKM